MNRIFPTRRAPFFQNLALLAGAVASTISLHAHPGHHLLEYGPLHTVTSPYHLTVLALIGVSLLAGAHFAKQRIPRRALQSMGVVAIAVSAVLWGLRT